MGGNSRRGNDVIRAREGEVVRKGEVVREGAVVREGEVVRKGSSVVSIEVEAKQ